MRRTSALLGSNFKSTFLSCETDQERIWRKLFVESRPYSDKLKKLLIINTPNCLDDTQVQFQEIIDNTTLQEMKDKQYIKNVPKLSFGEHEEVRSYILLEFDNFSPTENSYYRDCTISITIICHLDYWELDDYKLRPFQIAGYIDGILNETRLSGIGTLEFMGASEIILNEYLGGVLLRYRAVHGREDVTTIDPTKPGPQDLGFPPVK